MELIDRLINCLVWVLTIIQWACITIGTALIIYLIIEETFL